MKVIKKIIFFVVVIIICFVVLLLLPNKELKASTSKTVYINSTELVIDYDAEKKQVLNINASIIYSDSTDYMVFYFEGNTVYKDSIIPNNDWTDDIVMDSSYAVNMELMVPIRDLHGATRIIGYELMVDESQSDGFDSIVFNLIYFMEGGTQFNGSLTFSLFPVFIDSVFVRPGLVSGIKLDYFYYLNVEHSGDYEQGYNFGYENGFRVGGDLGYDKGYAEAHDIGYDKGYLAGYNDSDYDNSLVIADLNDSHVAEMQLEYERGYDSGYSIGYNKGQLEISDELGFWDIVPNTIQTTWTNTIEPVFQYKFFGIKIMDIWLGLTAIAVGFYLLKVFRG